MTSVRNVLERTSAAGEQLSLSMGAAACWSQLMGIVGQVVGWDDRP